MTLAGLRELVEADRVPLEPLAVRVLLRAIRSFSSSSETIRPSRGVHEEHAARLQPALLQDPLGRDVEDADLGRHHDEVVLRDVVARGPQAVAVEDRAHADAVGEGDRGRAVPRLHQAGVELVERPLRRAHRLVPVPRLRHHHHHRVRQLAPGEREQLEHVVEHRRVGALGVDDGEDLLQVVAEQRRPHHRLARVHPVDVAAQRVDLAVVRDVAVRVRARPGREGVGREARVDHRDAR